MKTKNLNYAFNVEYYSGCTFKKGESFKEKNRELLSIGCSAKNCYKNSSSSFTLQTRYPGLLVGIGNAHGSGGECDINLGFTFDYVTGCPYIPGSSVKGVLRSAFRMPEYIKAVTGINNLNVEELENEIFEGVRGGADIPIPSRDTFYDAFPETEGHLIDIEAITPHGDDLTKEPVPLTLLKVKPNVKFLFSFKLFDGIIVSQEKLKLFKQIILDFGAGAKTNVGFGCFTDTDLPFNDKPPCAPGNDTKKAPKEKTMVVCPECGTRNFKFIKDKNVVTPSWQNKICYKCKASISSAME